MPPIPATQNNCGTEQPSHTSTEAPRNVRRPIVRQRSSRRPAKNVKSGWILMYGLQVTVRDPVTSTPSVVSCRFCYSFGREKKDPRNRNNMPIKIVKHWRRGRAGFRTDNFVAHNRSQHETKWAQFQVLDDNQRRVFFLLKFLS